MNNQRIPSIKALSAAAAIIFAVGLHTARVNAQAGGAPTDPQIVGIVEAADSPNPGRGGLQPLIHFDVSPISQFDAG
jgi:hypothetical protein